MAAMGDTFTVVLPEWMGVDEWSDSRCRSELGSNGDGAEGVAADGFVEVVVVFGQYPLVVLGGGL